MWERDPGRSTVLSFTDVHIEYYRKVPRPTGGRNQIGIPLRILSAFLCLKYCIAKILLWAWLICSSHTIRCSHVYETQLSPSLNCATPLWSSDAIETDGIFVLCPTLLHTFVIIQIHIFPYINCPLCSINDTFSKCQQQTNQTKANKNKKQKNKSRKLNVHMNSDISIRQHFYIQLYPYWEWFITIAKATARLAIYNE